MTKFDLIVIGAGPAGVAAASCAAKGGARVLLLDEQPRAGGQIYRDLGMNVRDKAYLGEDYFEGKTLLEELDNSSITTEFGATVWRVEPGAKVAWSQHNISHISKATHVLLACGAQERPTPFPGWTLPGVMSVGAAQVLIKNAGLLPRDAILAGCGPLLYFLATQLIDAGARPKALVETQTIRSLIGASRHLGQALWAGPTLFKGMKLIHKIKKAGVPRYTASSAFRAQQNEEGNLSFQFTSRGKEHTLTSPILLTHQGVIPTSHISRASGVAHVWNDAQKAYQPITDKWGATDIASIHIAGDGAGIYGAEAAQSAGRIAALNILCQLDYLSQAQRDKKAKTLFNSLAKTKSIRPFLDAAYAPSDEVFKPADSTIVCRCEELTAKDIREACLNGALGTRQIKIATRAGMGTCQGRMCDPTIRGILETYEGEILTPRARTPIKPVKLGELAALDPTKNK